MKDKELLDRLSKLRIRIIEMGSETEKCNYGNALASYYFLLLEINNLMRKIRGSKA